MVSNIIFNYAKVTAQERAAIDTPYCITGLFYSLFGPLSAPPLSVGIDNREKHR
jgi:hypothetical protein